MRAIWVVRWQNRLIAGMARSYPVSSESPAVGARHARDLRAAAWPDPSQPLQSSHSPLWTYPMPSFPRRSFIGFALRLGAMLGLSRVLPASAAGGIIATDATAPSADAPCLPCCPAEHRPSARAAADAAHAADAAAFEDASAVDLKTKVTLRKDKGETNSLHEMYYIFLSKKQKKIQTLKIFSNQN